MSQFCAIQDIEAFLQISIPAEKVGAALRAIEAATEAIRNWCHQQLDLVEDDAVTLDIEVNSYHLFLPEMPVVSVASVVEDGETLVVDDDYKLGQHGVLHRVGRKWEQGVQIVTVTYTHGYETIPADIVDVCARAAARAYQAGLRAEENAAVPGITAKSLGDYSVQFGAESGASGEGVLGASAAPMLLRSERDMLARYRYVNQ